MSDQAMPTPAAVMQFLDSAAGELDRLGKELEQAHIDLGDAETVYEQKMDDALLELVEEYELLGKRLPGEDVRQAKARKRIDFSIYSTFRKAKRRVEGLNLHSRKLETAISARQSTLKGMREEANLHQGGFSGRQR
jgi:light-regulated signal transduction histidine kinase (bacteriophytochrome)